MSCFCSFYVIFGTLFKELSFHFVIKLFNFVPGADPRNIRRISAISRCPVPSIQIKEQHLPFTITALLRTSCNVFRTVIEEPMREKRKKNPLNVQIGLRIKECHLNRHMTQEHVSEQPNVDMQYVSGLERGVTGLLLEHSSTGAKSRLPAPTTFCWANGQVPTRCSMPGSISSRMSRRRRSWTSSKTSHSLRNCPGSKKPPP